MLQAAELDRNIHFVSPNSEGIAYRDLFGKWNASQMDHVP
jgi:hypothetical protein